MRDDFPDEVKRTLANRAALICSNPDCGASTAGPREDPSKALNIGVAAHITAASPGGPRYDTNLTPDPLDNVKIGHDDRLNCIELLEYG
jgi:hypothetical protein